MASTLFAGSLETAVAAPTPAAEGGGGPSCDSPPDTPDATPANRDRFVDLWLGRFRDQAFLDSYVAKDAVPDNIRAEGFHAMGAATKGWLSACLVDAMLAVADEGASADRRELLLTGANLVIFGKSQMAQLRQDLNQPEPTPAASQQPAPEGQDSDALQEMTDELTSEPSLRSRDLPRSDARAPSTKVVKATSGPASSPAQKQALAVDPTPTALALPPSILSIPLVPLLLAAVNALLQLIATIQGILFTLPVLNILASAFYKICAESPTMPLKCSISLPVGIPIPADVDGDNFPDVTGWLSPLIGGGAVGAKFQVQRLFPGQGKEPAHVFAVYDPPIVKKRIQVGFDGRADTLANRTTVTAKLHNVLNALTGDVNVSADVASLNPGSSQALTFAIKSLVGGSIGVPATEADPVTGAVQMTPVPANFDMNARLIHTSSKNQDIFTVGSSVPTKLDAIIDQATTTTTPKSNRRFTATVDKLPTAVTVDLVGQGETQTIDYTGSAPINLVRASDKATPNVAEPNSFTESIYEVKGVPTHVNVKMQKAEDILYSANAKIPEVSFQTRTEKLGVLQQHISAVAHQIPKSVHVVNTTTEDQTAFTYDADTELQDVQLAMYDLNEADETNLQATAEGIPTHMEFVQNKTTGVYDFSAPDGIDLIEASLSRNGGAILPLPGQDHATVLKVGDALGLDFQLSGFASAHFDSQDDLNVALGLNPGGQSFDAIADLDDPNVLGTVHISNLPSSLEATASPSGESVTYDASSSISQITADIELRDTGDTLGVDINGVPTAIALQFDADGSTITWNASGPTDSVAANAHLTPASLGGTRTFDADVTVTSIPATWDATWANGNVHFRGISGPIGALEAQVTNHGVNHLLPGNHVSAFYRAASGDLDASFKITNIADVKFTKLGSGDGGGFEAALNVDSVAAFNFAADVVLSSGAVLKASGNFTALPAPLTLRSDGGRITYSGGGGSDLTVAVQAGTSQAALNNTPAAPNVHGVALRDGASGADRAVKANLYLTGLPSGLDLNPEAGTYQVTGYHPSIAQLVVDVVLTTIAAQPLSLYLTQGVPTANPVDFTFGPFATDTLGDGTKTVEVDYTASEDLGALNANVTYGVTGVGDEAQLYISEIPSSINVNAQFAENSKHVGVAMSHGITDISAAYKTKGAVTFAASVGLHDVPSAVDIQIGSDSASSGGTAVTAPDFTMTASQPGLDINATVTAAITDPIDAHAAAELIVTDLGSVVTGALEGTSLHVTSSPATGSFLFSASGELAVDVDLGFDASIFHNEGTLNVHVDIFAVTLGFQDASDLILDLGVTTGLKGDFSGFQFGLDTDTEIEVHDRLSIDIDWPFPFGSTSWTVAELDFDLDLGNVIEAWHVNENTWGEFASLEDPVIGCGAHLNLIPGPGFDTTSSNTLNLGPVPNAPAGFEDAWLITPDVRILDLSLPSWAMDLVAFFASPYDTDWDVDIGC